MCRLGVTIAGNGGHPQRVTFSVVTLHNLILIMFTSSFVYSHTKAIYAAFVIGLMFFAGALALKPASAEASVLQCGDFTFSMSLGSRDSSVGNQVSELQKFLAQDKTLYPEAEVTGYFGPQTQKAVQRFQSRYGIVTSGTPQTTGYGSVGTLTRTYIERLCAAQNHQGEEDEEDHKEELREPGSHAGKSRKPQ